MRFSKIALIATMAVALVPAAASAADINVSTTGTDSVTCGAIGTPCLTISQAVTNSVSGDRVVIGNGTFVQTATINPGTKSIEIVGNGPGNTRISGGDANAFATGGLIRFQGDGTTVAVRDLTITGLPKTSGATATRFGVWVQPTPTATTSAINATIENVRFVGSGIVSANAEIGLQAANNAGTLTVSDSEFDDLMGNQMLLENQHGAVSVDNSSFEKPLTSSGAVIYNMLHTIGATAYNQTGLHSFTNNTFNAGQAIAIVGGWNFGTNPGPSAFPIGVSILDNSIDTLSGTSPAISLTNAANTNDGVAGQIDNVEISGNSITGATTGPGIVLQGGITDPLIWKNNIRDRTSGVTVTRRTQSFSPFTTWDHHPTDTQLHLNQIVGNATGLTMDSGVTFPASAVNNWWGCNEGPGETGCDAISQPGSAVDDAYWAVLEIVPALTVLPALGSSGLVAGLARNSDGTGIQSILDDGTTIGFAGTGGNVAAPTAATTDSLATNTFTSTGPAGRSASAAFDNASATYVWDDADFTAPVVDITAPTDGLVTNTPQVTLEYTVTDAGDPDPDCSPADGSTVDLDEGLNTITVTCTDAGGNVGMDSVTVRLDTTPPVVNILSPQNNSNVANDTDSTTLTYEVGDYGDPNPICSPVSGSTIPLNVGANTIVVTCTDAAGNVGTSSVTVTRAAAPTPPTPPNPDPLPQCARDVVVTNVVIKGSRYSQISGVARSKFVGQTVRINYRPSGNRMIGRATVRPDGTFSAVVRRPASPAVGSNMARYRAVLGGQSTPWTKLSRRLVTSSIVYANGKLNVAGRVVQPVAPGRRLTVTRSDQCGGYRTIGTIAVKRDGTFSGSLATDARADSTVPFVRLFVKVRRGGRSSPNREFTTYSIVRPVPILP